MKHKIPKAYETIVVEYAEYRGDTFEVFNPLHTPVTVSEEGHLLPGKTKAFINVHDPVAARALNAKKIICRSHPGPFNVEVPAPILTPPPLDPDALAPATKKAPVKRKPKAVKVEADDPTESVKEVDVPAEAPSDALDEEAFLEVDLNDITSSDQ